MAPDALAALWYRRVWLGGAVILAAIGGFLASSLQPKTYRASALVQAQSGRQASGEFVSNDELLHLTNVMVRIARTRVVAEEAAKVLPRSHAADFAAVEVTTEPEVEVLRISAPAGTPARAALLANTYSDALVGVVTAQKDAESETDVARLQDELGRLEAAASAKPTTGATTATTTPAEVQALQTKLANRLALPNDTLRILESAAIPVAPASPKPVRDAALAAVLVLLASGLGVIVATRLNDRFDRADDAARLLDLPVLGQIPVARGTTQASDEAFRTVRTSVDFAIRAFDRPVVLVTGAEPGSGKTFVSSNLARALAAEGLRVVAVDTDLRRPTLHNRLGVDLEPGLGDTLGARRGATAELHAQEAPTAVNRRGGGLEVVAGGSSVPDPAEALASIRMDEAVRALRSTYDLVILDSPPLLAVADALVLSRYASAVVLVVDRRRDRAKRVRRAVEMLRSVDAPLLGIVFNSATNTPERYGTYGKPIAPMP